MALRGAYRLPKDIGEMALRFIKDGMEPGSALGTARMLSNDPQDPVATAYTKDLMGRLAKVRDRFAAYRREPAGSNTMAGGGYAPVNDEAISTRIALPTLDRALVIPQQLRRGQDAFAVKRDGKTAIPRALQLVYAKSGAERRLIAEVANAASAGDRNAFLEILAELGFREDIAKDLANRYVPEILEYKPARWELL